VPCQSGNPFRKSPCEVALPKVKPAWHLHDCACAIDRPHPRNIVKLPTSPLPGLKVVDLLSNGVNTLQAFFEANPLYFLAVNGEPAQPGEADEEIHGELPVGWPFTHKYVFGYRDASGELEAMANVISDLLAKDIWHIGTFIVATRRHGTGDAQVLYESLERWAQQGGARWMRLGVVEGNARAEAFWERRGYRQVTKREGMLMGKKTNTIRVMAKPLLGQPLSEYYSLVERDRPAPASAT
jgi:GNAT superfamily N-acetyltransferase